MTWGAGGNGGRVIPDASPEAARGFESSRGYGNGPRDDDPRPRPGCLRTVLLVLAVLAGLVVLFWLAGAMLHLFG